MAHLEREANMMIVVSCKGCGKDFSTRRRVGRPGGAQRFCTRACAVAHKHSPAGVAGRFWPNVDKGAGPDGCWLWTGRKNWAGYGQFSMGEHGAKYQLSVHRMSYEMVNPPLGDMFACHRCDVRACVNPAHIFAGTALDNVRDMIKKGRDARGERSPVKRMFTAEQVRGIRRARANGDSNASIAERFKIDPNHIGRIVNRSRYAWVTDSGAGAADR